jgi:hypothetical protein
MELLNCQGYSKLIKHKLNDFKHAQKK